uniref:Uncharacterized protein n=1 Tax=Taenia asiatica TaxID=60517 RepID=A0A0R3VZ75_TAEAS
MKLPWVGSKMISSTHKSKVAIVEREERDVCGIHETKVPSSLEIGKGRVVKGDEVVGEGSQTGVPIGQHYARCDLGSLIDVQGRSAHVVDLTRSLGGHWEARALDSQEERRRLSCIAHHAVKQNVLSCSQRVDSLSHLGRRQPPKQCVVVSMINCGIKKDHGEVAMGRGIDRVVPGPHLAIPDMRASGESNQTMGVLQPQCVGGINLMQIQRIGNVQFGTPNSNGGYVLVSG